MGEDKLFETEPDGKKQLNDILQEELEYFTAVLQYSQKFLKQIKSLPIPVLGKMINYRQHWIDKIQKLEQDRAVFAADEEDDESKTYLKKISQTAKKLVKTDERIFELLQQRKIQIVNERSNVVSESQYTKKQMSAGQGKAAQILNIVQE